MACFQFKIKRPTPCLTFTLFSYNLNHAILVVGFGHDAASGLDYWLIKNSWGKRYVVAKIKKIAENLTTKILYLCV